MEQLDLAIAGNAVPQESRDTPDVAENLPLAARLRPRTIEEYVGQQHLLADGKLLRRAIDAGKFNSIMFSGPPGVGKTSLAELIANSSNSAFIRLSGVVSSVADIRREIASAIVRKQTSGRNTILFIDEIHRFNKAQQDVLLPDVETGNIQLIGATTLNPNFYIIGPLLSRSLVFQLEALKPEDIKELLERAVKDERGFPDKEIELQDKAADFLSDICEGDARKALTALDLAVITTKPDQSGKVVITPEIAEASIQKRMITYGDDGHYDTASAFIKSMRGSDPDAAVYWLAKMLHAGEDIRFIARRIVIFASEDIGNADPRALSVAVNAMQAIEMIGMPEARIILSQAVTYCSTAPKSNAAYAAVNAALSDIKNERVSPVPRHLRDASYKGAKEQGNGQGYQYPHDFEGNFAVQDYLGIDKTYYSPKGNGYELKIKERIDYWNECRQKNVSERVEK
jgi:putative ATPase